MISFILLKNAIYKVLTNLDEVISDVTYDGNVAIEWFAANGMQANPDKFQFMLLPDHLYPNRVLP